MCSTGRHQHQFAPLVVGNIGDVRDAAYARARDELSGPPTLLALDEVANIAPIPDLPAMVSEGASQGLLVLACLQDLSQARIRWGQAADGFLSLFGTTVVLRGIADTSTLRDISALAGDHEVAATRLAVPSTDGDAFGPPSPSDRAGRPGSPSTPWRGEFRAVPSSSDRTRRWDEVNSTPSHEHSPWRELVAPACERSRGDDRQLGR